MNVDEVVKLLNAVASLVGTLAWPLLAAYVLVRYASAFKEFFASLSEFTFKGGGFEATAKKQEATAALVAATVDRTKAEGAPPTTASDVQEAASAVDRVDRRTLRKASSARALWVDDNPDNNVFERQSLEALGVRFVTAASTDEALDKLAKQPFDVVISDMGRPSDQRAGYTLLERLRANGNRIPFVIYSGSDTPEFKAEARRRGAFGSTNRASELFRLVLAALGREN